MRTPQLLIIIALIVLSGCIGGTTSSQTPTPEDQVSTETPSPTATPNQTPTATESPTSTPTPEPPDNPWKKDTVEVSITNPHNPDRDLRPLVNDSLRYWEENDGNYSYYEINYTITDYPNQADIWINVVDSLEVCGSEYDVDQDFLGCATVLSEHVEPENLERVKILKGLSDDSFKSVLKHELGHLHGLEHNDQPSSVMNKSVPKEFQSKTDAVDRSNPWESDTLTVYSNLEDLSGYEHRKTSEQLNKTLDYYEAGADGHVDSSVSFKRVDNKEDANITILFEDNSTRDEGSTGSNWGMDTDTDDQLEYYTESKIVINDIPEERRGWHIGYWFGYLFGAESVDEFPPPFDEPDSDDREDWW